MKNKKKKHKLGKEKGDDIKKNAITQLYNL